MKTRNKISALLLYSVSLIIIITALAYIFSPVFMPYHVRFLGRTHQQIEPRITTLLFLAMRLIGGLMLSVGIVLAVLTAKLRSGLKWIRWTIFVMMIIVIAALEYVMLNVGIFTPWWLGIIALFMICTGLYLSETETE